MSIEKAIHDYEGSYLLGEADGDSWATDAHLNEIQTLSLLQPDEVGQRDIFGKHSAEWLGEQAASYGKRDTRFDANAYFDGFLMAVRRARRRHTFAVARKRQRW
jgi:hypothetical protein